MKGVTLTDAEILRFHGKYRAGRADECWEWQAGRKAGEGYGRFGVRRAKSITLSAHRVAYFLKAGTLPDEMDVLHKCDNPPCVNPNHLFLGTNLDNIRDRDAKGRTAVGERHRAGKIPNFHRGEHNPFSKLNEGKVREIRQRHQAGTTQAALAREHGVTHSAIYNVIRRGTWAHVE